MATSLFNLLSNYKIVIPIIQRDYAQGRDLGKVPKIRERFLKAIFSALKEDGEPLELDFVYGYTKENSAPTGVNSKSFIPLDGQQRLTTLFLLHWYIAVSENHYLEAKNFLLRFTYETRHSSRVFCSLLSEFVPKEIDKPIKDTIINQSWFFAAWENDPTISSMLTMLNAIQAKVKEYDLQDIWPQLVSENPKIVFHLLPMDKLGLPDDLYIKMNSRGKELTEFEYFKSQFSEILSKDSCLEFNNKIDQDWSDLFWSLYKNDIAEDIAKLVDDGFLRFFNFLTDMLIHKKDIKIDAGLDELESYKVVYSNEENVSYLFACLDKLTVVSKTDFRFFQELFYIEENGFDPQKTRLFFLNPTVHLFRKCSDLYDITLRSNPFSIGEQIILYACIEHLLIETAEFPSKIRIIRNLISNSEDTVRKDNMPSLLCTVDEIINSKVIGEDTKFNKRQIDEEAIKQQFIRDNIHLITPLYKLEDHHLLQGCLAIFELNDEIEKNSAIFRSIFKQQCDYDLISRALLTFGDYSQSYDWRRRLGNRNNSVWRELLTPSQRRGEFLNTKDVLSQFCAFQIQNSQCEPGNIVSTFLESFEINTDLPKDWIYYYIRNSEFRHNEDGFYYWQARVKPYECIMMRRTTLGGFNWSPFLYALNEKSGGHTSLENYGKPLLLTINNATIRIFNINAGYRIEAFDDEESKQLYDDIVQTNLVDPKGIYLIRQNEQGLDIEDRIDRGLDLISKIKTYMQSIPNSNLSIENTSA